MEKFVDRIIETDRKARDIIEDAQTQKQKILADAQVRADKEIARHSAEAEKGKRGIDEEFKKKEQDGLDRMDVDYLTAKRALDAAFEGAHDAWLAEITRDVLAAE